MVSSRSPKAPISGSWVTRMRVAERFFWIVRIWCMTSRPVFLSRLPVGSSARITCGFVDERTGDGHTLLFAAGEFAGFVVAPVCQAPPSRGRPALLPGLGRFHAPDEQRHHDVLDDVEVLQQVVELEDETHFFVSETALFVLTEGHDVLAIEEDLSFRGLIKGADNVEEGALAGSGRSHDGDEFTFIGGEINAFEDVDHNTILLEGLSQPRHLNNVITHSAGSPRGRSLPPCKRGRSLRGRISPL